MAAGTANYELIVIFFVIMTVIIAAMEKFKFGYKNRMHYTLSIAVKNSKSNNFDQLIEKILKENCQNYILISNRDVLSNKQEYIYSVLLLKNIALADLIDRLNQSSNVESVNVYNNAVMVEF